MSPTDSKAAPPPTAARLSAAPAYHIFQTAAGHVALAWTGVGIAALRLPAPTADFSEASLLQRLPAATPAPPPPAIAALIAAIQSYFAGAPVDFTSVPLDLRGSSPLAARIYAAVGALRWGETTTYGAIAHTLELGPQAARAVGVAMARNPVPLIVPCHRVLAAGGRLGGFTAPGGTASKAHMLALEGVRATNPKPPSRLAQTGFDFDPTA